MSTLLSTTLPAPGIELYPFLRSGSGKARFLWRDQTITLAGIGTAAEIFGWGDHRFTDIEQGITNLYDGAQHANQGHPDVAPTLFGGFSFTSAFVPDVAWAAFYPAHFILPHYQLSDIDGETFLTINIILPDGEDETEMGEIMLAGLLEHINELQTAFANDVEPEQIKAAGIHYPMSKPLYRSMLNKVIGKMRAGDLDKVVLARICEIQLESDIRLTAIFPQLDQRYGDCNRFLFEPRPFNAFYGATPETLISTHGPTFTTMGLAGSAPRGKTEAEDTAFGDSLLNSDKNRYEHQLVVDSIKSRLEPISKKLTIDTVPELMKLGNIQHLYTPISGELKEPTGILPLIELLHPTPALGGKPRDKAMAFISSDEPVTRGWYGAPVGIIGPSMDGRFGVAIRSAVAQRQRVWAYAGGGIVADSQPDEEWEETEIKFRPMLEVFG